MHAHHQYYTMHVKGYHFTMKATDMIMKVNSCFVLVKETARNYLPLFWSFCLLGLPLWFQKKESKGETI
jgi:hypothetical protein